MNLFCFLLSCYVTTTFLGPEICEKLFVRLLKKNAYDGLLLL